MYVRRAFVSYEVTCLQHQRLPLGQSAVHFQFLLPQSHPNRSYHNVKSLTPSFDMWSLRDNIDDCNRAGAIAAYHNYQEFLNDHESIAELYDNMIDHDYEHRFGFNLGNNTPRSVEDKGHQPYLHRSDSREPTNIL